MATIRTAGNLSYAEVNACLNGGVSITNGTVSALTDGDTLILPPTFPGSVPSGGTYTVTVDSFTTTAIPFNSTSAQLQNIINLTVTGFSVTVTGDYTTHFDLVFSPNAAHIVSATVNLLPNDYRNTINVLAQAGTASRPELDAMVLGNMWASPLTISSNITIQGASAIPNQTVIPGKNVIFDYVTNNSRARAIVRNVNLKHCGSTGRCLMMEGTTRPYLREISPGVLDSAWSGGFEVDNVTFSSAGVITNAGHQFYYQDWVVGVVHDCWFSLSEMTAGSGVIDCNYSSVPGRRQSTTIIPSGAYAGIRPAYGVFSYSCPYVWGGGPAVNGVRITTSDTEHPEPGWWADYDAVYVENCVMEKLSIGVTSTDGVGGVVGGGGKIVIRHCSMWCQTGGHMFGGTGNCASGYIMESYNNYLRTPYTSVSKQHNTRGGAHVFFNEIYEGDYNGIDTEAALQIDRVQYPNSSLIGSCDGTNFFDKNHRGNLTSADGTSTANGATGNFSPILALRNPDSRIGDVYATGNLSAIDANGNYKLYGLTGAVVDQYRGFTFRNKTACDNSLVGPNAGLNSESLGGMYDSNDAPVAQQGIFSFLIGGSTASATDAGGTFVTMSVSLSTGASATPPALNATDTWELRWIDKCMGATGGSTMGGAIPVRLNGGDVFNALKPDGTVFHGYPAFMTTKEIDIGGVNTFVNQYWCDQKEDGDWQWNNKYRIALTPHDGATGYTLESFGTNNAASRIVLGGRNDGVKSNCGPAMNQTYPTISATTANRIIGADWNSGTFDPSDPSFPCQFPTPAALAPNGEVYSGPYPHPLLTGVSTGKIISLSGTLDFGNVQIGSSSPTSILRVSNLGDTTLSVTAITTPTAFTVDSSVFTVPASSFFDVLVTFTPLSPVLYSGNIVVASDAIAGSGTIACSGTGINPANPVHGHRKQPRKWGV